MPDLPMCFDMDVVNVLLGLDRLARGLAENCAQLGGGLLPLRSA